MAGVEHRQAGAEREHARRVAGVRHREPFEPGAHALDCRRPRLERLLGEDAEELVAPEAVERVACARLRLRAASANVCEHVVAGLVAVGVVVRLEVVDVEHGHAVAVRVARDARLEQIEVLLERAAGCRAR